MVKVGPIQAYADGLLDDDELAQLADTSTCNVPLLEQPPRAADEGNTTQNRTSAQASPRWVNATSKNKLPPRCPSGPSTTDPQSGYSSTTSVSKEELEVSGYRSHHGW